MTEFRNEFGEREVSSINPDEVFAFLSRITNGAKQTTKRIRYSLLKAVFNFIRNNLDPNIQNPCDTPIMRKVFRAPQMPHWSILEKDTVDEIIFRQANTRNRLILEIMARGGLRISEVLKLTPRDVEDQKLALREPKSGKQVEYAFIPIKLADRLREYIRVKGIETADRIFPISYAAVRIMVQ